MEKWPIPVCRSAHFLLFICAGGRISVSIVVEAVEGVVRVIEHVYTSRCWAPLTLLAKAQQQQPILLLRTATMLCSLSLLSSAGDGCLHPPPPLSRQPPLCALLNLIFTNLDFHSIYLSPALHSYPNWHFCISSFKFAYLRAI